MHRTHLCSLAAAAAAAAVLTACGGGGGGDGVTIEAAPPATEVPGSAQASVPGLIAYLQQLIANTSETTEPVILGNAVLPTDDQSEPASIR